MRALFSLILASTFAFAAPAVAQDKATLKAAYKEAKAAEKDLAKATKTFIKGVDKGKDSLVEKADDILMPWVKAELKELRQMGIPSQKAQPYEIEGHEGKMIVPEPERPKLEARRDMLVDLRDATKEGVMKGKKAKAKIAILEELMDIYAAKTERKKAKFKGA